MNLILGVHNGIGRKSKRDQRFNISRPMLDGFVVYNYMKDIMVAFASYLAHLTSYWILIVFLETTGFNCGEAANFGTPQWLKVAKEAAVRRAAMNYLPMLSHQQLLYLSTMSFISRSALRFFSLMAAALRILVGLCTVHNVNWLVSVVTLCPGYCHAKLN